MSARPVPRDHRWWPMAAALLAGTVTTLVVLPAGLVPAAFRAAELHLALETGNVLVGLLVALLVYGRYRTDRRLDQLLLVDALVVLGGANVALALAAGLDRPDVVDALRWASVGGRSVGSGLLCAAALVRSAAPVVPWRARTVQGALAAAGVLGVVALVAGRLPAPVVVRSTATATEALDVHPVVIASQVVGIALLGVAAVAFTRRALDDGDRLTRWLAAGTVLATFARLHYLLYPSLLTDVVYTGDVLRAGFYGCLLLGALQEIEGYWRLRARTAVLDERRRIARDLHDGMTQELTFILARSRTMATAGAHDPEALAGIEDAAARALDEARRAIDALDREDPRPLADELARAAADLAGRHGVVVDVEAPPAGGLASPEATEQLLRILGEAVTNAVRHGGAGRVVVRLAPDDRVGAPRHRLTVTDDGRGFRPGSAAGRSGSGGYGLTSMRERAAAIGGTLEVRSTPGRGTTVAVTW